MKNLDSKSHVRGESIYLDDIPLIQGTLYACVFDSPVAHGKLNAVDTKEAEQYEGVYKIITAKDLIGENQIGGIIPDVDIPKLNAIGIKGIFLPGTPMQEIVDFIRGNTRSRVGI